MLKRTLDTITDNPEYTPEDNTTETSHNAQPRIKRLRICVQKECQLSATFGDPVDRIPLCCKQHIVTGMVDVKHIMCITCGNTRASYALPCETKPTHCSKHMDKKKMVNIGSKKCEWPGCITMPVFGDPGTTNNRFCKKHKSAHMVDVRNKPCIRPGCLTQPSFGTVGTKTALYCHDHMWPGMVNVRMKSCIEPGCFTQPHFANPGETKALYCSEHASDNMVDVITRPCLALGCYKRPSYGREGDRRASYCYDHKSDDMIIRCHRKICVHEGCDKSPSFGNASDGKALYCGDHKSADMVNVCHVTCAYDGCWKRPNFGDPNTPNPVYYCHEHKADEMVDIVKKKCNSEWCNVRANSKYDGYCSFCYVQVTGKSTIRNYKTKERAVVDYIQSMYPTLTWRYDHRVPDGCSKKRPDVYLDLGYQIIIIEVDEHQHKLDQYTCTCEQKRLADLYQDVGYRSIIMIRLNPDQYMDKDNQVVPSCWSIEHVAQISRVPKGRSRTDWNHRLATLKDRIDYWLNPEHKTDEMVYIEQLFYDCN